ncbi:MAG TPA: fumarylacetoacetate hydrolase family protein [Deinococcales bacterium]|nr:fumarylacetoacetate hydrolase family protein [Deinococcales bacterium]
MRLVRFIAKAYSPLPQWGELEGNTVYATGGLGQARSGPSWRLSTVDMLVPASPTKIVCVGKNYWDHVAEMGGSRPSEIGLFLKGPNALAQHGETVPYPSFTQDFHYEGELAAVIGRRARDVPAERALSYVAGYTCANDLSARDAQKSDLQWFRAKAADKFCPLGPWLETDIDPLDVQVTTRLNGEVRQDASTALMITPLPRVIEYVTSFMTLEAGDVILTGTPAGVGAVKPGDVVEVEVAGIGVLETRIGEPR